MLDFVYYFAIFYLLMGFFTILVVLAADLSSRRKVDEKPIRIIFNILMVLVLWYPLFLIESFRK